jgi:hypothetical protein
VHVRADAVQERRVQRVEALGAAQHTGRCVARERGQRLDGHVERRFHGAAERATQIVEDGALRFVAHVARNRLVSAVRDVFGERCGDGHRKLQID